MELSNSCGGVSVKKIFSFALAFVFLMLFTRYILQEEKTSETRVVMVGPGYGLEINGGRVLTALHIAEMMPFPIVYEDADRDIAIITTNHTNKYDLIFAVSEDDFLFTELAPKPGESGKPYLTDGKVYGVMIGESGGKGLVAALDESIVLILH